MSYYYYRRRKKKKKEPPRPVGRPPKYAERYDATVRMEKAEYEEVRSFCVEKGVAVNAFCRKAILKLLEELK